MYGVSAMCQILSGVTLIAPTLIRHQLYCLDEHTNMLKLRTVCVSYQESFLAVGKDQDCV